MDSNGRISKHQKTPNNLLRSMSFAGWPVAQRVSIEQLFKTNDGNYIIRKYSCERSYDKHLRPLKCTVEKDKNRMIEDVNKASEKLSKSRKLYISTPMEVDGGVTDTSTVVTQPKILSMPKKVKTELPSNRPHEMHTVIVKVLIALCLPILLGLYLSKIYPINCDDFKNENITSELSRLVYGQPEFVSGFQQILRNARDKEVIVFVGGIGVGKTHAVHVIAHNFPWNIINVDRQKLFNDVDGEKQFRRQLTLNKYNLVIIDNVEVDEVSDLTPFVKSLLSSEDKIFVIIVVNVQTVTLEMEAADNLNATSAGVRDKFIDANIEHSLFTFNELDLELVKRCIRYAIAQRGLDVTEGRVNEVLSNVNYEYSGCKGVYGKVALLT